MSFLSNVEPAIRTHCTSKDIGIVDATCFRTRILSVNENALTVRGPRSTLRKESSYKMFGEWTLWDTKYAKKINKTL